MTDLQAVAWSRQVFGEVGPHVRVRAPQVLVATHDRYVANQIALGLESQNPYGLIWLGMPQALVEEFRGMAGVQLHRPKRGHYRLPVINGVPLIPWRYAKNRSTNVDHMPFGNPVSATKKSWFSCTLQPELPLGDAGLGETVLDELSTEQRQELDAYGEEITALAADHKLVAILGYASNAHALLRCYLGYAELGDAGMLTWIYREEVDLAPASHARMRVAAVDGRPAFDAGQPLVPALRLRAPLEGAPTDEPPATPGQDRRR